MEPVTKAYGDRAARKLLSGGFLSIALISSAALASPASDLKTKAKTALSYPLYSPVHDRCSLGAAFSEDAYVVRLYSQTPLELGDQIIDINGDRVGTADEGGKRLSAIPSTAKIPVTLRHGSETKTVQVTCEAIRANDEAWRDIFTAASKGDWTACLSGIDNLSRRSSASLAFALQCFALTKGSDQSPQAVDRVDAFLDAAIAEAKYSPALRSKVSQQLPKFEGVYARFGRGERYKELLKQTQAWNDTQAAVAATSGPDYGAFRQKAENYLRSRLIDPDSGRFEWPYGFLYGTWKPFLSKTLTGYWTCGMVNARNRMGGYTGSTYFVVVLDDAGSVIYGDMGTAKDYDLINMQCEKSVRLLPPAPASFTLQSSGPPGGTSVPDQLEKLARLLKDGLITKEEFDTQKAKLLGEKD